MSGYAKLNQNGKSNWIFDKHRNVGEKIVRMNSNTYHEESLRSKQNTVSAEFKLITHVRSYSQCAHTSLKGVISNVGFIEQCFYLCLCLYFQADAFVQQSLHVTRGLNKTCHRSLPSPGLPAVFQWNFRLSSFCLFSVFRSLGIIKAPDFFIQGNEEQGDYFHVIKMLCVYKLHNITDNNFQNNADN